LADVHLRVGIAVIAGRTVHFGGIVTDARARLAGSDIVALILCSARGDLAANAVDAEAVGA
jgi:hypothetical protein